jgi:hypothetical protein
LVGVGADWACCWRKLGERRSSSSMFIARSRWRLFIHFQLRLAMTFASSIPSSTAKCCFNFPTPQSLKYMHIPAFDVAFLSRRYLHNQSLTSIQIHLGGKET